MSERDMTLYDVPYGSHFYFHDKPPQENVSRPNLYAKVQGTVQKLLADQSAYSTWDGKAKGERMGAELLYRRCDTPVHVTNFRGLE